MIKRDEPKALELILEVKQEIDRSKHPKMDSSNCINADICARKLQKALGLLGFYNEKVEL